MQVAKYLKVFSYSSGNYVKKMQKDRQLLYIDRSCLLHHIMNWFVEQGTFKCSQFFGNFQNLQMPLKCGFFQKSFH